MFSWISKLCLWAIVLLSDIFYPEYLIQWIFTKEKKINKTRYFYMVPNFICRSNVIAKLQKPEGSIQNIIMLLAANHILWKVNEMAFSLVLIANFCKVLNPSSFFQSMEMKKKTVHCVYSFSSYFLSNGECKLFELVNEWWKQEKLLKKNRSDMLKCNQIYKKKAEVTRKRAIAIEEIAYRYILWYTRKKNVLEIM